jgi:glycosyltransferase involved in cell wall biosynthesis
VKLLVAAESLTPTGGWGSYTLGLLDGLVKLGVEPRVLLRRGAGDEAPPGVEVIACLSSPLRGLVRPPATARNVVQILRYGSRFDLLHFMVEPYVTASLPLGMPPTCITLHGTYAVSAFSERAPTRLLFGAALRRARAVICVSQFTQDALHSRLKLDNSVVIHNGHSACPDNGAPDHAHVLVDGRPVILGVGALKARKGYHIALRAVARLRDRFPNLRYYMVGDDGDRAYVERLRADIADLGLQRQAVITGPVSNGRLRAFYRQADLFLLTPINIGRSFEGFGIVYLEANAFGKPVVGSLGCGAEEAIEDGVNGLLAPQHDDLAISERAAAILSDTTLAARLGRAGRARAEKRTWTAVAGDYLKVYEQALRR